MKRFGHLLAYALVGISLTGCMSPQGRPDYTASGALAASWAEVSAEAVDDQTVRFTLATPIGGFLAAISAVDPAGMAATSTTEAALVTATL